MLSGRVLEFLETCFAVIVTGHPDLLGLEIMLSATAAYEQSLYCRGIYSITAAAILARPQYARKQLK